MHPCCLTVSNFFRMLACSLGSSSGHWGTHQHGRGPQIQSGCPSRILARHSCDQHQKNGREPSHHSYHVEFHARVIHSRPVVRSFMAATAARHEWDRRNHLMNSQKRFHFYHRRQNTRKWVRAFSFKTNIGSPASISWQSHRYSGTAASSDYVAFKLLSFSSSWRGWAILWYGQVTFDVTTVPASEYTSLAE